MNKKQNYDELPIKKGYERIYSSCGAYYDQPILNEKAGEKRCNGCLHPFTPESLITDGANETIKYVCHCCLKNGQIERCSKCQTFILPRLDIFKSVDKEWFGDKVYCRKCTPPIIYYFHIITSPYQMILEIPIDYSWGISSNYFYQKISTTLNIPVEQIKIEDLPRNVMLCPSESYKPEWRTMEVKIIDNPKPNYTNFLLNHLVNTLIKNDLINCCHFDDAIKSFSGAYFSLFHDLDIPLLHDIITQIYDLKNQSNEFKKLIMDISMNSEKLVILIMHYCCLFGFDNLLRKITEDTLDRIYDSYHFKFNKNTDQHQKIVYLINLVFKWMAEPNENEYQCC